MKRLLLVSMVVCTTFSITGCKHSAKDIEISQDTEPIVHDEISKEIFTDSYGDQMEVIVNNTKKTVTVHLFEKTYELHKSEDMPEYTANNTEYQYTDIKGNITFIKKGADMVLFRTKQNKTIEASSKLVSQ